MGTFTFSHELARKSVHSVFVVYVFLIDIFPVHILQFSLVVLGAIYYVVEELRLRKKSIPFLRAISSYILRPKEGNEFAFSPLALLLGIALTLEIYNPLYAKSAIIAVTIGDSVSSLVSFVLPRPRILWNKLKSGPAMVANMVSVMLLCLFLPLKTIPIIVSGIISGLVESLDLEQVDNLIIPLAVGAVPYFTS